MRTPYNIIIHLQPMVRLLVVHLYDVNNVTPQNLHIRFVHFCQLNLSGFLFHMQQCRSNSPLLTDFDLFLFTNKCLLIEGQMQENSSVPIFFPIDIESFSNCILFLCSLIPPLCCLDHQLIKCVVTIDSFYTEPQKTEINFFCLKSVKDSFQKFQIGTLTQSISQFKRIAGSLYLEEPGPINKLFCSRTRE